MFNNPHYGKYTPLYSQANVPLVRTDSQQMGVNKPIIQEISNNTEEKKIDPLPLIPELETKIIPNVVKEEKLNFLDKNELFDFINNKFSKLDEALMSFKQERYPTKPEDLEEETQTASKKENVKRAREQLAFENPQPAKKQKKSYGFVDDTLFTRVKEKWPNFPEDKKESIVVDNDGNFFISKNKKKIPLNNVNALKLINKK